MKTSVIVSIIFGQILLLGTIFLLGHRLSVCHDKNTQLNQTLSIQNQSLAAFNQAAVEAQIKINNANDHQNAEKRAQLEKESKTKDAIPEKCNEAITYGATEGAKLNARY